MQETLSQRFQEQLPEKPENHPEYVTELVDFILSQAQSINASDIHLLPTEDRMRMDWRIDGVLHHISDFSHELAPRITSRLKSDLTIVDVSYRCAAGRPYTSTGRAGCRNTDQYLSNTLRRKGRRATVCRLGAVQTSGEPEFT